MMIIKCIWSTGRVIVVRNPPHWYE